MSVPVKSGVKLLYVIADLVAFDKAGISTLGNFCALRRFLLGITDVDVIVVASILFVLFRFYLSNKQ